MDDFSPLSVWLKRIETQLNDSQKRRLTQRISTKLKQSMARRIKSQVSPSGARFVPRKHDHKRSIRRGAMFQRLPKLIKNVYSSTHAEVGFAGHTATVMEVHQFGKVAKPSPNARAIAYPVRETVGFSPEDEQLIIKEIENFFNAL